MCYHYKRYCESISKGFRVTDLTRRVNARVVANVDAGWINLQTHALTDKKLAFYISYDDALYLYKVL